MLNSLATGFERKILFGLGRHFWNVVGVAGVISLTTGCIFTLTSSKEEILSKVEWIKESSASKEDVKEDLSWLSYYERDCGGIGLCEKERNLRNRFIAKHGANPANYEKYTVKVYESNMSKQARSVASPLLIGWGAGTVAGVSVISAILAVERNTRPNQ